MSRVQLAGSRGPKPFSGVVKIPNVQVANLRALWSGQAHKRFCRYFNSIPAPWLAQVGFHQCLGGIGDFGVKVLIGIDLGTLLREVGRARLNRVTASHVGLGVLAAVSEIRHEVATVEEKEQMLRQSDCGGLK